MKEAVIIFTPMSILAFLLIGWLAGDYMRVGIAFVILCAMSFVGMQFKPGVSEMDF